MDTVKFEISYPEAQLLLFALHMTDASMVAADDRMHREQLMMRLKGILEGQAPNPEGEA